MATFGKLIKGTLSVTSPIYCYLTEYVLPVDATIIKLYGWFQNFNAYAVDGSIAVYDGVNRQVEKTVSIPPSSDGFVSGVVSKALVAGTYGLALKPMKSNVTVFYDTNPFVCYLDVGLAEGDPCPVVFGRDAGPVNRDYSVYAEYTPLGGGSISNSSLIALGLGAWLALQKKKKRMKKSVLAKKIARDAMKPMVKYFKKVDEAIKKAV